MTRPLDTPAGLCLDVGNVLISPSGDVIASFLSRVLDRPFEARRCYEAILLADKDGHLSEDPAAFWEGEGMALSWGRHLGIEPGRAVEIWEQVLGLDEPGVVLWSHVNPEAAEVLGELRRAGVRLAAVSNADGRVAEDLEEAGLTHHFSTIIDSEVVGLSKPDPRIFLMGAEGMGVDPGECWHVEDTAYELGGALQAGFAHVVQYDPLDIYGDVHDYARIGSLMALPDLVRGDDSACSTSTTERDMGRRRLEGPARSSANTNDRAGERG